MYTHINYMFTFFILELNGVLLAEEEEEPIDSTWSLLWNVKKQYIVSWEGIYIRFTFFKPIPELELAVGVQLPRSRHLEEEIVPGNRCEWYFTILAVKYRYGSGNINQECNRVYIIYKGDTYLVILKWPSTWPSLTKMCKQWTFCSQHIIVWLSATDGNGLHRD